MGSPTPTSSPPPATSNSSRSPPSSPATDTGRPLDELRYGLDDTNLLRVLQAVTHAAGRPRWSILDLPQWSE